jgi:flagellar biogenesis protein FliO
LETHWNAIRAGLTQHLAAWLSKTMRRRTAAPPQLTVVERIALAPRQTLALIEAEGRRFLVATSPEGPAAFYPLDEVKGARSKRPAMPAARRIA